MFGFKRKKRMQNFVDNYMAKYETVLRNLNTLGFDVNAESAMLYAQVSFDNDYSLAETVGGMAVIGLAEHVKYREARHIGFPELFDSARNTCTLIIENRDAGHYREDVAKMDARAAYELGQMKEGSLEGDRIDLAEMVLNDEAYRAIDGRLMLLRHEC